MGGSATGLPQRTRRLVEEGVRYCHHYSTGYAVLQTAHPGQSHVAPLWSASPTLTNQISATEALLNAAAFHINATDCSSSGWPNNVCGYGRLDINAAVDAALVVLLPRIYLPLVLN